VLLVLAIGADTSGFTLSGGPTAAVFEPNGSGGFTAPPECSLPLTKKPGGSYIFLREQNNAEYRFLRAVG
jgi:hypothetical protein